MIRRSSPDRRGPRAGAVALLLAAVLAVTGCGGDAEEPAAGGDVTGTDGADGSDAADDPDQATQSCRDQWRALAEETDVAVAGPTGEATATPSGLRTRYVTVAAQIDYYAAAATADDCDTALADERALLTELAGFREQLVPFDVELALADLEADPTVTDYTRPEGEAGEGAPRPVRVAASLDDLRRLAPQATAQQSAGWQQAAVVDLADAEAREQAVADLQVVSEESAAYRDAQQALEVLERAAATGG